jgi:hypothetical protein
MSSQLTRRRRGHADDYPEDGTYDEKLEWVRGRGFPEVRHPRRQARMGARVRPTASLSEPGHSVGKEGVGTALHRVSQRHL